MERWSGVAGPLAVISQEERLAQCFQGIAGPCAKKAFIYSETYDVDLLKLKEVAHEFGRFVLILTASASSYLWLDAEHGPSTLKVCQHLLQYGIALEFVVRPTTAEAKRVWAPKNPQGLDLAHLFHGFLKGPVWIWDDQVEIDIPVILPVIDTIDLKVMPTAEALRLRRLDLHRRLFAPFRGNCRAIAVAFGLTVLLWRNSTLKAKLQAAEAQAQVMTKLAARLLEVCLPVRPDERETMSFGISALIAAVSAAKRILDPWNGCHSQERWAFQDPW